MKVNNISMNNNSNSFGMRFKLSKEAMNIISKDTRLSQEELINLPLEKASKLMHERGAIEKESKIKSWFSSK